MLENLESPRLLRAFLCHSSDDKALVRNLYQHLRADGIEPWLDEEDLLPGEDWHREIPKAVRNSDIVIICLSRRSINKNGYLQREIKLALDVADEQPEGTIFLIPVKLEECEVPERLNRWQWVNLFEERGYQRLLKALARRAQSLEISINVSSKVNEQSFKITPPQKTTSDPNASGASADNNKQYIDTISKKLNTLHKNKHHSSSLRKYVATTAAGMVIIVSVLLVCVYMAFTNSISNIVFYIILIPLGCGISALIFVGIRYYAIYKDVKIAKSRKVGIAITGAMLVILSSFSLIKYLGTFDITVRAFNANGETLQSGSIAIYMGQGVLLEPIGPNGEAGFKNISVTLYNKPVEIRTDVTGYKLAVPQQDYKLSKVINLTMEMDIPEQLPPDTFDIIVRLTDSESKEPLQSGQVEVFIDKDKYKASIGTDGTAILQGVASTLRDKNAKITATSKGYTAIRLQTVDSLSDKITLEMDKDRKTSFMGHSQSSQKTAQQKLKEVLDGKPQKRR